MKRVLLMCLCATAGLRAADYAIGADLSLLKQNEDRSIVFKDHGEVNRAVQATPFGLGKGVFWWEPAVSGERGGRILRR